MKIAYLLGSLNMGGTEILLLDNFRQAKYSSFELIGIYRNKGMLFDDFSKTGVRLFQISPKNRFDIFYILRLRRLLKREMIDVAHAQQPLDALYAYLACLGLKIKVALTIHGYDFRYKKLTKDILKFVFKRTDLNVFVSKSQQDYFSQKYSFNQEQSRVVYNGISFNKFDNYASESLRDEFGISLNCLLLGSVGNFNPARDQMTICRFLNLLNKHFQDFAFIFAGIQHPQEPDKYEKCVHYCDEHGLNSKVFFPGLRNDIPNFLSQLDAFIYSTDHDTFGLAIIEAMYSGTPVFVNNWEVMVEITGNGKHGIIYKTKDEIDLDKNFREFLICPEKYKANAKRDAEWVKETYSIQNHLKILFKVYKEIL